VSPFHSATASHVAADDVIWVANEPKSASANSMSLGIP
jgi:hypothetical protein